MIGQQDVHVVGGESIYRRAIGEREKAREKKKERESERERDQRLSILLVDIYMKKAVFADDDVYHRTTVLAVYMASNPANQRRVFLPRK